MSQTIGLRFGALSPSIADQVKAEGHKLDAIDAEHFQKDADAITRLRIRGFITPSQADAARKKLIRQIGDAVTTG